MSNKSTERKQLTRIDDLVIEDIIETSDAEIMAEAEEDYANVADVIQHTKELVISAIASVRKVRLTKARRELESHQARELESHQVEKKQGNVFSLPLNVKKQLIESAKNHDDGLTLAARNEEEMSEGDTDTMLQDLIDLGKIDEDGNSK